ncbi:hypothetical protein [Thermoleptolyngbya sp.]
MRSLRTVARRSRLVRQRLMRRLHQGQSQITQLIASPITSPIPAARTVPDIPAPLQTEC